MTKVSTCYKELTDPSVIAAFAASHADAWQDHAIATAQALLSDQEISRFNNGASVRPFDVACECMNLIQEPGQTILDVGSGAGIYGRVFAERYKSLYFGCDFSEQAVKEAKDRGYTIELANARALPYADKSFDVVLSGATIMHVYEWRQVISELSRIAKRWLILHRTPVTFYEPTKYYDKLAYGHPCLEIHFNVKDLFDSELKNLKLWWSKEISRDIGLCYSLQTFLFAK